MKKQLAKIYKDIDMGFTKNFVTGDIGRKYDTNAVRQAIKNIIYTNIGERPFNPLWGSQIHRILFEPIDEFSKTILAKIVKEAIENHEPRVSLEDVIVKTSADDNSYNLTIFFYVVGVRELQEMAVVLTRLR